MASKRGAKKSAERDIEPAGSGRSPRTRGYGSSRVYDTLRREILELRVKPDTLLDETELAARFKLSRSPVREALIRLSVEGLVKTLRNRSTMVASFDIVTLPSYLDAVELLNRVTTRLAAQNRTPAQLEQIRRLQKEHEAALKRDDTSNMIRLNSEFHAAIAEASGNSFFATWSRSLLDQGQRMLGLYIHSKGDHVDSTVLADHVAIVRAIELQDADAAEEAGRRDAAIIAKELTSKLLTRQTSDLSVDRRSNR